MSTNEDKETYWAPFRSQKLLPLNGIPRFLEFAYFNLHQIISINNDPALTLAPSFANSISDLDIRFLIFLT